MRLSLLLLTLAMSVTGCAPLSQNLRDKKERDQYMQAARDGDPAAQYKVARTYCCGLGPFYNTRRAIDWFCRAARQGYVPAQLALANMYSDNLDDDPESLPKPPVDFVSAYMWYTVAAAQGNPTATLRRAELDNMMAAQDINTAKENATRWRQYECPQP